MAQTLPWYKYWPNKIPQSISYPDIPVFGMLSSSTVRNPNGIAVLDNGRQYTYKDVDTFSNSLAMHLIDIGIKKNDRVVIYLRNSIEYIVSYYGILKAGAIVVPVSPLSKEIELAYQLDDSGTHTIIFLESLWPVVERVQAYSKIRNLISTGENRRTQTHLLKEILMNRTTDVPKIPINPKDDVAVLQYTGGTTGIPKGAMLTHRNLVCNAMMNAIWFSWTREDRVIGVTPFYHTWGPTVCINSPLYAGASIYIMRHFDPEEVLEAIEKYRITIFYGVTSLWKLLMEAPSFMKHDVSSLRYVKAGGMPVLKEIKEEWEKRTRVPLIPGYGLTEASPETHNNPIHRVKVGSIGIPIMDTLARIVDSETGEEVLPPGEEGELVVKGPQVMKGYWQREEESNDTIRKGWLYTGDVVRMDEDGYFYFVERKKDMIKYKGYGVFPSEVEDILRLHYAVDECSVVGRPDPIHGEIPLAFIVLRPGQQTTEKEIIEFCRDRIAPYKRIREVRFIKELPRSAVGKIQKRRLLEEM